MKLRCPRQHRIGEVCGAKLVDTDSVTRTNEDCKLCQEIVVKQRKLQRERDNVERWKKEGTKFAASIEKSGRDSAALEETIQELRNRRPSVIVRENWMARREATGEPKSGPGSS